MSDDALFDTPRAATRPARGGGEVNTHSCAKPGCLVPLPARWLMCGPHWRKVPLSIQARVWRHYKPGQTALTASPEYLSAVEDAIAAVEASSR